MSVTTLVSVGVRDREVALSKEKNHSMTIGDISTKQSIKRHVHSYLSIYPDDGQ